MKNIKITICLLCIGLTTLTAQEKEPKFNLSAEEVAVYDYTVSAKGAQFDYQFEDDYTLKLTNKVYKIKLFFEKSKTATVQRALSKIMDGDAATAGFDKMVWKKTLANGKPIYEIALKDNHLLIHIKRKQMDDQAYERLTSLGRQFLKVIHS